MTLFTPFSLTAHLRHMVPFAPPPLHSIARSAAGSFLRGGAEAAVRRPVFRASLLFSAFSCTTVFGMMLLMAIVVMPGFARLSDGEYLKSFKAIDGIIQDGQPLFALFWLGSVVSLFATAALGVCGGGGDETDKMVRDDILLVLFTLLYLAGQVSTFRINLPLNAGLQKLDIDSLSKAECAAERLRFEAPWVRANWFRTVSFGMTSVYLLVRLILL